MPPSLPRFTLPLTLTKEELHRLDELCNTASLAEGRTINHEGLILRSLALYDGRERGQVDSVFWRKEQTT
jgi:hypothetical protein